MDRPRRRVVDRYKFDEGQVITRNVQQVHVVHKDTEEEYMLRRIALNSPPNLYSYIQQQLTMLKWLNHQGVPKCHRMFKTQSHLYLVYDNLPGYMLTELLQNGCPFPRVLEIVGGLLDVLKYLEQREVVHGSISPSSIMLLGGSKVMVINFGYSLQLIKDPLKVPQFHKSRTIDKYTPPETKNQQLTSTSDVYSLGAVLMELLNAVKHPSEFEKQYISHIETLTKQMLYFQPSRRPKLQDVNSYFANRTFFKQIISMPSLQNKKKMTSMHSTPKKSQQSQMKKDVKDAFSVSCQRQARKILARRNFEKFMLQIALLCGRLPLAASCCLPLGIVMVKKATALSAQLLKAVQTGSGGRLKIDEKTFSRVSKQRQFIELETMLKKQMSQLIDLFSQLTAKAKAKLPQDKNSQLFKQLTTQAINSAFLNKSIRAFLCEAIEWLRQEAVQPEKNDLILICVLLFLLQERSIDQSFQEFFGESGQDLWQESLMVELELTSDYNLQKLIVLEGEEKQLAGSSLDVV